MKSIASFFYSFILFIATNALASDSQITGPSYEEIIASHQLLAEQNSNRIDFLQYGESAGGYPLYVVKISKKNFSNSLKRKAAVITGAIHGYEYLNIADRLTSEFLRLEQEETALKKFIADGGIIYIVPIFNPDGYAINKRRNANDVDLNRDYSLDLLNLELFTQPETNSFKNYLESEIKTENAELAINFHYHCCGRYQFKDQAQLAYPWAHTLEPINLASLKLHQTLAKQTEEIFEHFEITSGQWAEQIYEAKGTASDYFFSTYKAITFIFEGMEAKENLRLDKHTQMWENFFRKLNSN